MGRITALFDSEKGGWYEENKPVWRRGSSAWLLHDLLTKQTKPARNGLWRKPCGPCSSNCSFGPAEKNHPSSISIWDQCFCLRKVGYLVFPDSATSQGVGLLPTQGISKCSESLPAPHTHPVLSAHWFAKDLRDSFLSLFWTQHLFKYLFLE